MRAVVAFAAAVAGVVVNDFCEGALPVGSAVTSGTNLGTFGDSNIGSYYHDVFYSYNASCSGTATASIAALAPVRLSAFWGPSCNSFHNEIDSAAGSSTSIEFGVRDHQVYYLAVAVPNFGSTTSWTLNVVCTPALLVPGDFCENAVSLTDGINPLSSIGASVSGIDVDGRDFYKDVWGKYNATCSGEVLFSYPGSLDGVIGTFEYGENCAMVGMSTYDMSIDDPEDITAVAVQGLVSYVVFSGYGSSTVTSIGDVLEVTCTPIQRPVNDRCFEATTFVAGINITGTTMGASKSPDSGTTKCGASAVWYRTTATCTGTLHLEVDTSSFARVSFFDSFSTCTDLRTTVASDRCASVGSSGFDYEVQNGSSYYFLVASGSSSSDIEFTVSATCTPLYATKPENDLCSGAIALTGEVNTTYSNVNASQQMSLTRCPRSMVNRITGESKEDVWYVYTPTCSGFITISASTSGGDYPQIYVLGGNCSSLSHPASCSESSSTSTSSIVPSVAGVPIYFALASYYTSQSAGNHLMVTCQTVTLAPTTSVAPSPAVTPAPSPAVTPAPSSGTAAPSSGTAAPSSGTAAPSSGTAAPSSGASRAPTSPTPTNGTTLTGAPTGATQISAAAQLFPVLAFFAGAVLACN